MAAYEICHRCKQAALINDLTPITVPYEGRRLRYFFHNAHDQDCLSQTLTELKKKFESEPTPAPSH
jgi:hypothetical protein